MKGIGTNLKRKNTSHPEKAGSLLNLLRQLKLSSFLMLTIAGIVNAIGITIFLAPVKLYDSGISGTAMLISQITPHFLSLSLFLILLNLPLFLYGLKKRGGVFTVYAVYAVFMYSLCAWLITDVLPVDVSIASPLAGQDLLLCALFGGVISGIGSGLAIRAGGAMDGIEVLAVIFNHTLGISVGSFVMGYNLILYVLCGLVIHSWILPLYSIVAYAAATKTVDFLVDGVDRARAAMIVTDKPQLVSEALSHAFSYAPTHIQATGGYTGKEKAILYYVINRFQVNRMGEIVHSVDPAAFITTNEVYDIFSQTDALQGGTPASEAIPEQTQPESSASADPLPEAQPDPLPETAEEGSQTADL